MNQIVYREGYKYQLAETYRVATFIEVGTAIKTDYIRLAPNGVLTVKEGYAWDGPSGPTKVLAAAMPEWLKKKFLKSFMCGSLVHDALYQLMRERLLDHDTYRKRADRTLQRICLEDGMSKLRAWWVYQGVRLGGGPAADPNNENPVLRAP